MANVTVSYGVLNMSKGFPFAITHTGQVVTLTASPTQIHVLLGGANFANYNGAFQFFGGAIVGSSTLFSYEHHAASLGYTLSLSSFITVGEYFGFLDSGNAVGLRDFILSGNDSLTGGSGNDVLIAGLGADTVDGGAGSDRLDGGGGPDVDSLTGGDGNDSFVYDGSADAFIEESGAGSGVDTVLASQSYSLSGVANIENITLTGVLAIDATGSELGNFLLGNAAANHLTGAGGNDTLDGGAGNDTMSGGADNDLYLLNAAGDVVSENAAEGIDTVRIGYSVAAATTIDLSSAYDGQVENLQVAGAGAFTLIGNATDNILTGNASANLLDGGLGDDTLVGGAGSDTYVVDSLDDVVTEAAGGGTDMVQSSITMALAANVENLTLTGAGNIDATGNALANILTGNEGSNVLDGQAGDDRLVGGAGNDTYVVLGTDTIVELAGGGDDDTVESMGTCSLALLPQVENITLTGSANVNATGNAAANVLEGNDGNNTLDGRANADTMSGGLGNDVFLIDSTSDVVLENAGQGNDTVLVAFNVTVATDVTVSANVETLRVTGTGQFHLIGDGDDNNLLANASANSLDGGDGNDTLDGGAGLDTMTGGTGNDLYVLSMPSDVVDETGGGTNDTVRIGYSVAAPTIVDLNVAYGGNIENLRITGAGAFKLIGNGGGNILTGNAVANLLDGGAGDDTLIGGAGSDTYVVDSTNDVVTELAGGGTDLVQSSASFTLSANVENLTLTGSDAINATGNTLANVLTGNAGNNVLDGQAGNDRLVGAGGDDTYVVLGTDTIVELAAGGIDTVQTIGSYSIALLPQLENITLEGSHNTIATGNAGSNTLTGNVGNNVLDGLGGADIMIGGLGDDTFVFGSTDDVALEDPGEGSDTVRIAYNVPALLTDIDLNDAAYDNIENVVVTGLGAFNLIGDAADNNLIGNASANTLEGGLGNDTLDGGVGLDSMSGGAGNDVYVLSMVTDIVDETGGDASDTVLIRYGVAAETPIDLGSAYGGDIENLQIIGAGAFKLIGNGAGNILTGNASANLLDGGGGADTMNGGLGGDTYIVDDVGDVVNEAGAGVDLVKSSVSYALSANVENLTLTASDPINATGNTLANILTGNDGANVLDGGIGIDRLVGAGGDDTYVVDNVRDVVVEVSGGGSDLVQSSVTYSIALLAQVENLELIGAGNVNATGNAGVNELTGNSGNNLLLGGAGNDTLSGNAGNDTLDGGLGDDNLSGGIGDDVFVFNSLDDVATENLDEGTDTVRILYSAAVSASIDLGDGNFDNIENLVALGAGAFTLTGNALANLLVGNASANTLQGGLGDDMLDGGAGLDSMSGGDGNDLYVLSMPGDQVSESGIADTSDTVRIAYSVAVATTIDLGSAYDGTIENLQVTGAGAFRLTGNEADNILTGNASANLIDGVAGADTMNGGLGGDTYIVDNLGDVVNEAGAGVDLVKSSVSYALSANVENLTLTGLGNIDGTGNGLANILTGNDGANMLDGGAGIDRLVGGGGNDTYVVLGTDTIVELAGGGTADTVQSAGTYSLALLAQVENLTLTSSANVNATGNAAANTLTGNDGNNILDGRTGTDTMSGGLGDDVFVLDSEADQVLEDPGEGSDTVRLFYANPTDSTLDLTTDFGGNIENVEVLPARALFPITPARFFSITGNAADNRLAGNGNVNLLSGGDGNDTLSSGFGDSFNMIGGAGADQFVFEAPYRDTSLSFPVANFNVKVIQDFETGIDTIVLDNDFFPGVALGELATAAFVSGAGMTHAQDASDRVIYDTTSGNLYYDPDGIGTAGFAQQFGWLSDHPALAASDFEVVN